MNDDDTGNHSQHSRGMSEADEDAALDALTAEWGERYEVYLTGNQWQAWAKGAPHGGHARRRHPGRAGRKDPGRRSPPERAMSFLQELDQIAEELRRQNPGWQIWYVPRNDRTVTWCARPWPLLNSTGPEHLEAEIAQAHAEAAENWSALAPQAPDPKAARRP